MVSLNFLNHFNVITKLRRIFKTMQKEANILRPPKEVQNMKQLDKTLFEKVISVACLQVNDVNLSSIMPYVKSYILKIENFKPVASLTDNTRLIYFNPEKVLKWTDLSETDRKNLLQLNINDSNFVEKQLQLKYENYTADDILKSILPADLEGSSSYTKLGHIVHVNLREHLLPFKHVIGRVLHDKVHGCRTVVNKVNMIDNTYRNFSMELLSGDDDMTTRVKENGCTFEFDFSKVYWNSRLCTEHERIVKILQNGDVLCDVFAGVGPFSIPAAKKKCLVFANDLNPESHRWLLYNGKINKVGSILVTYCKDGRDFIREDVKGVLLKYLNECNIYITMNLPGLAVEFLEDFVGLLSNEKVEKISKPIKVFLYCFAKGEDYINITKNLVLKNISIDVSDKIEEIFRVRTVSNFKEMMRVTLILDEKILLGNRKRKIECGKDVAESKRSKNGEAEEGCQQSV